MPRNKKIVDRIGITALNTLKAEYKSVIAIYYTEQKTKIKKKYDEAIELFIHDIDPKELDQQLTLTYQRNIEIHLFSEKNSPKICGDKRGFVCPLLDEEAVELEQNSEKRSEAEASLDTWYFEHLKPVNFEDFEIKKLLK